MEQPGPRIQPPVPSGRIVVPEHVVRRGFEDETVVLNLETGEYHGLNLSAGRMLDVLEETGDAAVAAQRVAAEFDAPLETISADLAALCEALSARGLIVIDDG